MLPHILGCAVLAASVAAQLSGNVVTLDCKSHPFITIFDAHICQDGKFTGQQNSGTGVISFRGIRYADAPVGNLRWRAPVSPPSKNLGNVDATSVRFRTSQLVYAGSYFDSSPPHACRRRRKSQKPTSCSSTRPTRWTATLKTAYS